MRFEIDKLIEAAKANPHPRFVGVLSESFGRTIAHYYRDGVIDGREFWISHRSIDPDYMYATLVNSGTTPIRRLDYRWSSENPKEGITEPMEVYALSCTPNISWMNQVHIESGKITESPGSEDWWESFSPKLDDYYGDKCRLNQFQGGKCYDLPNSWICEASAIEECGFRIGGALLAQNAAGYAQCGTDRMKDASQRLLYANQSQEVTVLRAYRMLYIMKDSHNGLYKIGKSVNPKTRERTLQSEKPSIKMVFSAKESEDMSEKSLHIEFAEQRVRGEWFSLTPAQVRYICSRG